MIIKLTNSDVTIAQDDPDTEGIIHIPDDTWDHIVQEVEVPGQEWVNGLYLNIQDLTIGGSGLPIVIHKFKIGNEYSGNVYEINHKPSGQTLQLSVPNGYCVYFVSPASVNNEIYYTVNKSGTTKTYNLSTNEQYYYVTPNTVSASNPKLTFLDENNNEIFSIFDNANSDQTQSTMYVNKNVIDFLWLTN